MLIGFQILVGAEKNVVYQERKNIRNFKNESKLTKALPNLEKKSNLLKLLRAILKK